jgi:ClpP class serine protease
MAFLDESRAFDRAGLKTEVIKSGKFKGMGLRGTTLTDEERAALQAQVDKHGKWFRGHVRAHRSDVSEDALTGLGYTADEGVRLALIDGVGLPRDAWSELESLIELGDWDNDDEDEQG